jgi:hypothetical protein
VEKFSLETIRVVKRLCHYTLLWKKNMIAIVNPFQYVLIEQIVWGEYNKWIFILQYFDLDFVFANSKKYLVFAKLMLYFSREDKYDIVKKMFPNEHIFLISSSDPWYGYMLRYIHILKFSPNCL